MNEFITNPNTQAVLQILAAVGAVCLIRLFCRRARNSYLEWRERQDELDKIPGDFREHVLDRMQVLVNSGREITLQTIYDTVNGPTVSRYAAQGCRFSVDVGVGGTCFVVMVYNDKWRCKLLMPKTIPAHWGENDWPLDLNILNQCRAMIRNTD